ncbi:hypothetical protein D9M69_352550 [compost metagenome]
MSDKNLVRNLNALWSPDQRKSLSVIEPRGSLAGKRVTVAYKPPISGGGGGGIASPLTEPSFAAREYWPSGWPSSDGLFEVPAIKVLHLEDADGAKVEINLAEPPAIP